MKYIPKYIALVVEGQTEEAFVWRVLGPYFSQREVYFTATVPPTKRTATTYYKGGAPWREYESIAKKLAKQPHWHRVGVLLDLYGCPGDTPGRKADGSGVPYHQSLTASVNAVFEEHQGCRIDPHFVLNEFETLVLAAVDAGSTRPSAAVAEKLKREIADAHGEVEAVNCGPSTSPSHRILGAWEDYVKTVDGIESLLDVPFEAILERCPTFARWLAELVA